MADSSLERSRAGRHFGNIVAWRPQIAAAQRCMKDIARRGWRKVPPDKQYRYGLGAPDEFVLDEAAGRAI